MSQIKKEQTASYYLPPVFDGLVYGPIFFPSSVVATFIMSFVHACAIGFPQYE